VRLLILSRRVEVDRRPVMARLAGPGTSIEWASPDRLATDAGFADVDALIVDGDPPPLAAADLERIEAWVHGGGRVLAAAPAFGPDGFWAGLLGVDPLAAAPRGEYFAKPAPGSHHLTARVDMEFSFVASFAPVAPRPGTSVRVAVSIGFRDLAMVTDARRGRGRVVTIACDAADLATSEPLCAIARRALRPPSMGNDDGASDREDNGGANRDTGERVASIGAAIVGYGPFGGMGYAHGLAITATDGLDFVAVADPSDDRRKAAESDFAGVAAYASVDDLVADDAVSLVFVATPPSAHFGLVRQLLRAGKHVACEKPLCLTAAEADELIALSRAAGRTLTVHQNRRWDADYLAVRRSVHAGLLGEVFNVETFVGGFEHPCRAWHSDVEVSGGAVYDWGSHHIDWILQLLGGPPTEVITYGHKRVWHDVTNLDQLRVHLRWDDGREAEFFQSDVAAIRRPKFFVQGTGGTLVGHYRPLTMERIEPGRGYVVDHPHHAEAPADLLLARYESGAGLTETRLPLAERPRHAFHRNLADHLLLGEPLAVTAESVREVVAVLEASQQSSDAGGRPVTLHPAGE